jgi:AmiR/NasT family two-component response regulator
MGQRGVGVDEAFTLLRTTSQRENRKLRDIAQQLVDGARRD